jgi:hypothetical protein
MLAESRRVTDSVPPRSSSMSLVGRPADPHEPNSLARNLGAAIRDIGSPYVRQLVAGIVLIALMVLVLPLAGVVFLVTSVVYYGVLMLLGIPSDPLGAALGLTWFGGSLALIGWLCVLAWRRVALIRVLTGFASWPPGDEPAPIAFSSAPEAHADSDPMLTRIAAADARLAGAGGNALEDDEPTSTGR